jgi:hypothetical protein
MGIEQAASGKLMHDDTCLDIMRQIVKEYIVEKQQNGIDSKQDFKNRFEEYRQSMHDETLRTYTAFELMEKLYWQEYLLKG